MQIQTYAVNISFTFNRGITIPKSSIGHSSPDHQRRWHELSSNDTTRKIMVSSTVSAMWILWTPFGLPFPHERIHDGRLRYQYLYLWEASSMATEDLVSVEFPRSCQSPRSSYLSSTDPYSTPPHLMLPLHLPLL